MEILDGGNHEGGEKGEGRGGPERGWKAGGDARRNPAKRWWVVEQVRKGEASPRRQGLKRTRLTKVTPFDNASIGTLRMPAGIDQPNPQCALVLIRTRQAD